MADCFPDLTPEIISRVSTYNAIPDDSTEAHHFCEYIHVTGQMDFFHDCAPYL